jgi:hypothetical protein
MPTDDERRAAKAAVEVQVRAILPDMFESYVTDDHLWAISDAAVWAAEKARSEKMDESDGPDIRAPK